MRVLRAGTRGSALALRQTEMAARTLEAANPGLKVEPVVIRTRGDQIQDRSLAEAGGKGLFVSALEEAMLRGEIDFAVHSGKDLPAKTDAPFTIAAVSEREDPRDLLLSLPGHKISVVGTASPRRSLLISGLIPGCQVKLLRGNVPTRIQKLRDGQYDAIILAAAGVNRLGLDLSDLEVRPLSPQEMVPAACQGIMVCEALEGSDTAKLLSVIDHPKDHAVFLTERRLMRLLKADCHDAVGIYCEPQQNDFKICAFWQTPDVHEAVIHSGNFENELAAFAEELRV